MRWIRDAIDTWFRGDVVDRELEEEMQYHVERETRAHIQRGMDPAEARRRALIEFGGVERTKERVRGESAGRVLADLAQDVRYGLRSLARTPGYTGVVLMTLALGIGANTAIFSVIDGVLLDPLPYASDADLVFLRNQVPAGDLSFSVHDIEDLRERSRTLDEVVEYHGMTFTLRGLGEPELVRTGVVSYNFFGVLGIEPEVGRDFVDEDDDPGAEPVLMLAHEYWLTRFGGDPNVVGRAFEMNGMMHTVVGVLPPVPQYPTENDVYMTTSSCPTRSSEAFVENRQSRMMSVFARAQDRQDLEAIGVDLDGVTATLAADHPEAYDTEAGQRFAASPLKEELVSQARPTLLVLLGIALFVLMIACANVANLALARMTRREQELAVRSTLGAGRGRIVRQLVTESVMLSVAGGGLGLIVALATHDLLVGWAARFTSRAHEVSIDLSVLGFTLLASLLTGIAFGLAPALLSRDTDAAARLRAGAGSPDRRRGRLQGGLVVAQVALSFVLLVGAGLMGRSFLAARSADPGFEPEGVLAMRVTMNMQNTDFSMEELPRLYLEMERRLTDHPGVVSAAVTTGVPTQSGMMEYRVRTEETEALPQASLPLAELRTASPRLLETTRTELLTGRFFTGLEHADEEAVVVVNESLASRLWPGEVAVGRVLAACSPFSGSCSEYARVIGVFEDVLMSGDREAPLQMYQPSGQSSFTGQDFLVRTAGDPMAVVEDLRGIVHDVHPGVPVSSVTTLEQLWGDALSPRRLTTMLIGIFALLALAVSLAGLAGVVAFGVSQRSREIGIRMALGADRADVLAMVLRQGASLVAGGLVIGLFGAWVGTRWLDGMLWGVGAMDPATWAGVALMLLSVSVAACWIPARRATKVDPASAFRES
jgi:predicted permease